MSDLAAARRRLPALWADSAKAYAVGAIVVALPAIGAGVAIALRLPSDEFGIAAMVVLLAFVAFACSLLTVPWMAGKVYRNTLGIRSPLGRGGLLGVSIVVAGLGLFAPVIVFVPLMFLPLTGALMAWSIVFALLCRERLAGDGAIHTVPPFLARVTIGERRGGFDSVEPDKLERQRHLPT